MIKVDFRSSFARESAGCIERLCRSFFTPVAAGEAVSMEKTRRLDRSV
jgi:hypothetical protein